MGWAGRLPALAPPLLPAGTELAAHQAMSANASIAVYTLLGIAVVLLIFLAARAFVDAARKGNRQFKWASRGPRPGDDA